MSAIPQPVLDPASDTGRWTGVVRPYKPADIERLRPSLRIAHTLAETGARKLWRLLNTEDFVAAVRFLHAHPDCNGSLGVVGFCFGGWMANTLAWRSAGLIKAAVPYYGGAPTLTEVPKIKGSLLLHFAELDTRVNASWPDYEAALKAAGVPHEAHFYPGVNHGFHNDTTPRYDQAAAELSWERTVAFFRAKLG